MNFQMANNVFPKAFEVLIQEGFSISQNRDQIQAQRGDVILTAENTLELLGLFYLWRAGWQEKSASDQAIEEYLKL